LTANSGGGGLSVNLVGGFDRSYTLQTKTHLTSAVWSNLVTVPSGRCLVTDPDTGTRQKYRRLTSP